MLVVRDMHRWKTARCLRDAIGGKDAGLVRDSPVPAALLLVDRLRPYTSVGVDQPAQTGDGSVDLGVAFVVHRTDTGDRYLQQPVYVNPGVAGAT